MQNYTKEHEAIRQAFANFVGSLLVNSMYDGEEARENVLAILCEELVKYTKDENETINTKTSRPILKSTLWILQNRRNEMITYLKENNILMDNTLPDQYTKDIDNLIDMLDKYINKIGGE